MGAGLADSSTPSTHPQGHSQDSVNVYHVLGSTPAQTRHVVSFNPHDSLTLQDRLRKVKHPAQGHTASRLVESGHLTAALLNSSYMP